MKHMLLLAIASALTLSAFAQDTSQTVTTVVTTSPALTYRVVVISRSVQAVNYRHRSDATKVDFAGTALLPSADGSAKVRSKRGTMEVEAEFGNLQNPTTFGNEYLTYVLWTISPEGLECPALFVPTTKRETGMRGAINGAEEEVHAGADREPATAS